MSAPTIVRAYRRHRFAVLFYSLLLTLGAGPLLAAFAVDPNWVRLFLELNLLAAVFGLTTGRALRPLRLGLALIVAMRLVELFLGAQAITIATRPLVVAIGLCAAGAALAFALRAARVDTEHVYAALSAYLLAGIFAGMLPLEIERVWPGSYTSGGAAIPAFTLGTAIYFSFVVLAARGFGDIVPQNDVARGVTIVEAIAGQLYLAVLVARLIAMTSRPHPQGEA